jgi:hypothetical protein
MGNRKEACIERDPKEDKSDVNENERQAADDARYYISDDLATTATREKLVFVFGNQLDVLFDMALGHERKDKRPRPSLGPRKLLAAFGFVAVMLGVQFCGLARMVTRVLHVPVSRMRVVRRYFMLTCFVMLARVSVVLGRVFVMLCRLMMVLRRFFAHENSPVYLEWMDQQIISPRKHVGTRNETQNIL